MTTERPHWLKRLVGRLFHAKEPPARPRVCVEADGFSIVGPEGTETLRWAEVKEIFAYKADLFVRDLICVGFRISDDGTSLEIDEEMPGYKEVLAAMERRFPDLDRQWYQKVVLPPFKPCLTTLWGEPRIAALFWGAGGFRPVDDETG